MSAPLKRLHRPLSPAIHVVSLALSSLVIATLLAQLAQVAVYAQSSA